MERKFQTEENEPIYNPKKITLTIGSKRVEVDRDSVKIDLGRKFKEG